MSRPRAKLLYDGDCCFCARAARRLARLDVSGRLELVDLRRTDTRALDPRLTPELCEGAVQLLESDGRLCGGFLAVRRLSVLLPVLWPLAPLLRLPGASRLGPRLYEAVQKARFRLTNP